jgi:hypothetical protein
MDAEDTESFVIANGGLVSAAQLAEWWELDAEPVRDWAAENGVPMDGNAFAFDVDAALDAEDDLLGDDDDDLDEDEE